MRYLGQFLLIALVRGVLFLVPIVLIAVLAREGYQMLRLVGKTRVQLTQNRPSSRVLILYDYDPVHGPKGKYSRNALYIDGHSRPY